MREDCYIVLSGPEGYFPEILGRPNTKSTRYPIRYKIITSNSMLKKIKQIDSVWVIKFSPSSKKELVQKSFEIINTITKIHQLYHHYIKLASGNDENENSWKKETSIYLENSRSECQKLYLRNLSSYPRITKITGALRVEVKKNTLLKLINGEIKTLYSSPDFKLEKIPIVFTKLDRYISESEANVQKLELELQELSPKFQLENMIIGAILGGLIGIVLTMLVLD